jgi:hypothetical protein
MKKYFLFILSIVLYTSCDDGDLISSEVNSDSQTAIQKCTDSETIYKINNTEVVILNISDKYFLNQVTEIEKPRVANLGTDATAVFRKYSGTVESKTICTNPAPANPVVLEEWNITGGTIEITTKEVFDNNSPAAVIAYNHYIVLKNVTFISPSNEKIVYTERIFGNYRTDVTKLPFNFAGTTVERCNNKKLIFKYDNKEALLLELDPKLFEKSATPQGKPREALVDDTTNKVTYRSYEGNINKDFFCADVPPSDTKLLEDWPAIEGVDKTSGIIRVESEAANTAGTVFKFTIKLYKLTYKIKGGIKEFTPKPEEYVFGSFEE